MSTESVKGSEGDTLTSSSDAQDIDSPKVGTQRPTSDSEGEVKIKADTEDSEKKGTPSAGVRDSGSPERPSRSSSNERKSPTSRPRSSDSRPKSSSSGEVTFGGKSSKRRKKKEVAGDGHQVTFSVTVSVAIPTVEEEPPPIADDEQPDIRDLIKKKKRVFEAPRAQNYYHLEYYLVPEADELMKTDVVTYGMAAKIYMERHDPRVLKTWQDGDITWVAWSHSHTMTITKELLLKLYTHTLELRIWDTKDKVGTRAKFDRPKLFKLPTIRQGEDADEIGGVKGIVFRQSKAFIAMQPKKANTIRALPKEITFRKEDSSASKKRDTPGPGGKPESRASGDKSSQAQGGTATPTPHTLVSVPNRDEDADPRSSFSRLGRLAEQDETPATGRGYDSRASKVSSRRSRTQSHATHSQNESTKYRSSLKSAGSSGSSKALHRDNQSRRRNRRVELQAQSAAENVKKMGICSVPIRMAVFFSGLESVTNRLECPVPGVEDMFVTLQLDRSLLSEQQKQELNPMIIKLHSITNMPDTPIPQGELKDRCLPSFCKYSFFTLPGHSTLKRDHCKDIYFDDINVVLAGTFDQSEFRQYLNGPPLEIEMHDRDRKPEEVKLKATLFGDDYEDEKISNVGTVASRRTLHNPFKDRAKIWDPYGVARVDLSDLLLGQRFLYIKVPVQNCALPDLLGTGDKKNTGKVVGIAGAVDGPVDSPIQAGHYVASNTTLKVKVELAHPLVTPDRVAAKEHVPSSSECPFGRIIFKFDYKNTSLLNQLQNLISKINARALELDDMPQHVIDAALSTYKLSAMQQESRTLDIVTGFQVLDTTMHLFVLEGLLDSAVNEIWKTLPQPENSDVVVLYNSNLSFSSRLYGPLDVDLCRIKLHEPLSQIVKQPLLYVRDMVPKPCFDALVRIHELTKTSQVRNAIRNDLFPTADMVISMSKEFGVPFTTEDFEELHVREDKSFGAEATTLTHESFVQDSSRYWEPVDNINTSFMEKMVTRQSTGVNRDFIKENKDELQAASEVIQRERTMNKPLTVTADVATAHNYSSQALNSTELAKEKLRQILTQEPETRFTYCQDYLHSMTVVPVNVDALKKQERAESEARWKTERGWLYPGVLTTVDANVHPKKPHVARADELQERWQENILHVGLLQPPLDRDRLPWELRQLDIELYRQPDPNFGAPEPNTIHLAGEKLRQEKLAALSQDFETWKSKVVVCDTRQHFHRCLTETELRTSGRKAGNQLAKLQGLLKDSPNKLTLRKPGMGLRNIPPLNVVLNPSVDTDTRRAGKPTMPAVVGEGMEKTKGYKPGPYTDHGWILERNKIPSINYEHDAFRKSKGHDFNVYHKNRSVMWKKQIFPLTEDERDNHLFRLPDDPQRYGLLPDLTHSLGDRSLTQPRLSTLSANAGDTELRMSDLTVPSSFYDPTLNLTSEPTGLTTQQTGFTQQGNKQTSLPMAS